MDRFANSVASQKHTCESAQMFCRFLLDLRKCWCLSAKTQLLLTRAVLPEVYCGHMVLHLLQPLWWVKSIQSIDSDDVVQLIMKDGLDALIVESSG